MTLDEMLALAVTKLTSKTKVNDVVSFGPYCWKVLAKKKSQFLLITRDTVCKKAFNEEACDTNWRDCTLRKWLNDEFYNEFSDDEKNMIVPTDTKTGRYDSEDNVFLLTLEQAQKLFKSLDDRVCIKGFARHGRSSWWLRTTNRGTGNKCGEIDSVHESGNLGETHWPYREYDVRPAVWVDISAHIPEDKKNT